jgi:hypothetical protein
MWVNRQLFDLIVADNKNQQESIKDARVAEASIAGSYTKCLEQKAKDDLTIDWMRHRINALERANSILMNKVSGVSMPVPEIVASRPGTMSELPDTMTHMPSFEDVGDGEAARLGVFHNAEGELEFQDPKRK